MTRSARFVLLLLVLVMAVAVLSISILQSRREPVPEPTPAAETASILTSAPAEETAAVLTPAPAEETAAPAETPLPTEPPVFETRPPIETEPPAAPTPTPEPEIPLASGSFTSDTGTGLNLLVEWATLRNGGDTVLQVEVGVSSYSFFTSGLYKGIVLRVGNEVRSADSLAVSYDGKEPTVSHMARFTLPAPESGTPISVEWTYKGTYSGKSLDIITAESTLNYGR